MEFGDLNYLAGTEGIGWIVSTNVKLIKMETTDDRKFDFASISLSKYIFLFQILNTFDIFNMNLNIQYQKIR